MQPEEVIPIKKTLSTNISASGFTLEHNFPVHASSVRDPYVAHLLSETRGLLARIEQIATQHLQVLLSNAVSPSSQQMSSPFPASFVSSPGSVNSPPQTPSVNQNVDETITHMEVGSMTWDPINKVWRGNDAEGRLFELRLRELMESEDDELPITDTHKPARKGHIFTPAPPRYPVVKNGQIFDPQERKWRPLVKEHEKDDPFADIIVPEKHTALSIDHSVFVLTEDQKARLREAARVHNETMRMWAQTSNNPHSHLHLIKQLSFLRFVRDLRRAAMTTERSEATPLSRTALSPSTSDISRSLSSVSPSSPSSPSVVSSTHSLKLLNSKLQQFKEESDHQHSPPKDKERRSSIQTLLTKERKKNESMGDNTEARESHTETPPTSTRIDNTFLNHNDENVNAKSQPVVEDYGDDFEDDAKILSKKSPKSTLPINKKKSRSQTTETSSLPSSNPTCSNPSSLSGGESTRKTQPKRPTRMKLITPESLKNLGQLLTLPSNVSSPNLPSKTDLDNIPFPFVTILSPKSKKNGPNDDTSNNDGTQPNDENQRTSTVNDADATSNDIKSSE